MTRAYADASEVLAAVAPIPPENVKREGPEAVRASYKSRLEAADERHAKRVAAMREITE